MLIYLRTYQYASVNDDNDDAPKPSTRWWTKLFRVLYDRWRILNEVLVGKIYYIMSEQNILALVFVACPTTDGQHTGFVSTAETGREFAALSIGRAITVGNKFTTHMCSKSSLLLTLPDTKAAYWAVNNCQSLN